MLALIGDTETTSLIFNRVVRDDRLPEIIEFAAELVDLDSGEVRFSLNQLIRPRQPISAEITGITGITNEMLADAPSFKDCADAIFSMIESAPTVIFHNAHYDRECLDIEAERLGRTILWPPQLLCSVEQSVHLTGKRLTLSALHLHLFGEKFIDAHRALTDVQALRRCCIELFRLGEL